jgi:hypothetical protein
MLSALSVPAREKDEPMSIRTTRITLSFAESFKIRGVEGVQPPGEYVVLMDDELIEGISHTAYRRVATVLCLPSTSSPQHHSQLVPVTQTDLDVALLRDRGVTV